MAEMAYNPYRWPQPHTKATALEYNERTAVLLRMRQYGKTPISKHNNYRVRHCQPFPGAPENTISADHISSSVR